jgi:hypothetical protein
LFQSFSSSSMPRSRAFTLFQLMTILQENHHSFLIVEHDLLLYEDAEKRMMEYQVEAKMPWAQRMLEATGQADRAQRSKSVWPHFC